MRKSKERGKEKREREEKSVFGTRLFRCVT